MPDTGIMSVGTTLEYESAPSTWVGIAEVVDCASPEVMRPTRSVSALGDEVTYKKKKRFDAGTSEITVKYADAIYKKFRDWCRGEDAQTFRITTVDEATDAFDAHIVKVGRPIPDDDLVVFKVSLDVTGDPTFTEAA